MAVKRPFRERAWFFSPAIATALFFAIQLVVSLTTPRISVNVEAAAPETPNPTNLKIRVLEQIRPLHQNLRASTQVPTTEAELLELFHDGGAVVFFQDEVEVVETSEREFEAEVIMLPKGSQK
jgi:hypothetical protein